MSELSTVALTQLLQHLRSVGYAFTTPTPTTHERVNRRAPGASSRSLADAFGWNRPFAPSLLPRSLFPTLTEGGIISEGHAGWTSAVRASTLGNELFLHSAYPTIAADAVFFGPDTYRFARAIHAHLRNDTRPPGRAIDIGCGSGAGGAIVAQHAEGAEVLITDINDTALHFARINVEAAGLTNVAARRSDLFESVEGVFDLIVANPPYLNDALQRTYRHGGGERGSALSLRIAEEALDRLADGGTLLLYTGAPIIDGRDPLRDDLQTILTKRDLTWRYEEIDPDVFGEELETDAYADVDRIAAVLLTVRNARAS